MKKEKTAMPKKGISLYRKFALLIILAGILPIAVLSTVILDRMFKEYELSLRENYIQGLRYASSSIEQLFESYNDVSKFSYYYSYTSEGSFTYAYINYDNLRQILTGENFPEETRHRQVAQGMDSFLRNVLKMNSSMEMAHFLYETPNGQTVDYHAGNYTNLFTNLAFFQQEIGFDNWDKESRQLIIIPTHSFGYSKNASGAGHVFTIARNYYNLKGQVGREQYVGTLFLDFDVNQIESVFRDIDLYSKGDLYVCSKNGDCFYSSNPALIGKNLNDEGIDYKTPLKSGLRLSETVDKFGLEIYFDMAGAIIDERMLGIQRLMYAVVILAAVILSLASVSFSRRITKPMRVMMERMADIETGRFEGQLPVNSRDEIGQLAARFNQMSTELQNYTNQVYVSKIKQKEAELNALKSQIYPHFLYNTLEVIRMTAVSGGDEVVAGMVEALADQIKYLIGTVGDVATLKDEVSNLEKYIYLVNCRYSGSVSFAADTGGLQNSYVPKLVLQPIVENAFVHGLKEKQGKGRIQVDVIKTGENLEITVLDNGRGMTSEEVQRLEHILQSSNPGERTETGWRSIGLKNVHDRLRYLYGDEYGISMFSTPGVGTAIKVKLPANIPAEQKEEPHA